VEILDYLDGEAAEHLEVLQRVRAMDLSAFRQLVEASRHALQAGGKLLFFGNGGSAADAQHLATELTVRYQMNRRALSAIALTTDTSTLTAIGNDFGFDDLFARQVEALCREGDVAIGISTSGNSKNVIQGLAAARARGAVTAAFAGGNGGRITAYADHVIVIPSRTTARIQEMHLLLGHTLCGLLERAAAGQGAGGLA
jgi:D-sedoheptulose 7-phosphate isomerase